MPAARPSHCIGSVTDPDFGERFVQLAVDTYGGLDIIVNNAGYTWDSVIQKMTDEQWDAILDVHLKAPFRILRAAQPVISALAKKEAAEGGASCRKVVNISSIAGLGGNAGQANYSTAKAGITGLTKTLAKEWGRYNVTVNAVAFGYIKTRLTDTDGADHIDVAGNSIKVGMSKELARDDRADDPARPRRHAEGRSGSRLPAVPARVRLHQRADRHLRRRILHLGPEMRRDLFDEDHDALPRVPSRVHRAGGRAALCRVGARRHRAARALHEARRARGARASACPRSSAAREWMTSATT